MSSTTASGKAGRLWVSIRSPMLWSLASSALIAVSVPERSATEVWSCSKRPRKSSMIALSKPGAADGFAMDRRRPTISSAQRVDRRGVRAPADLVDLGVQGRDVAGDALERLRRHGFGDDALDLAELGGDPADGLGIGRGAEIVEAAAERADLGVDLRQRLARGRGLDGAADGADLAFEPAEAFAAGVLAAHLVHLGGQDADLVDHGRERRPGTAWAMLALRSATCA